MASIDVAVCTVRDYGIGMIHGLSLMALVCVACYFIYRLVDQQLQFEADHSQNLRTFKSHFGRNVVGSDTAWWRFVCAWYHIEIHGLVFCKITYDFRDQRFEYGNRVYYDIDTLVDQIKKDRQSERKEDDVG